jgi:hypothetical protein
MMQFDRQAQIRREIPPDADSPVIEYSTVPILVTAPNGLAGVVRPESGALDLQLRDILGNEIQVSLMPDHVKYLFDLLLGFQESPDEKIN